MQICALQLSIEPLAACDFEPVSRSEPKPMRAQTSRTSVVEPPRPQSRAERRVETRRRLIGATIRCLCDVGYFDTTTTIVADQANVSRGALQHHFRSRDDLFLAVIEHVGNELAAAFAGDRPDSESVRARVESICRTYWRVYSSDAYIAQVQIWVGAHNDRKLQRNIAVLTRRMRQAQDRLWKSSFSELGVPSDLLEALRSLTLSAVRGLALRPAYRLSADEWPAEISVLATMVAGALNADDRPAAGKRPAVRRKGAAKAVAPSRR
ncbi:MAG: TetR/AcrR family transcriptional regulator [Alphaproteobacteria bacterium]